MKNIMVGYERKYFFRLKLSRQYLNLSRLLAPYYFRHFTRRPYRQSVPAINYEYPQVNTHKRIRESLYDAMYNVMLDGYVEIAKLDLRTETGLMLNLLIDLTKHLDEYLDDESTDRHAEIKEILEFPKVKKPYETFCDYTEMCGCSKPVMSHLSCLFSSHFKDYLGVLKKANNTRKFEDIIEAGKIDTGIWLSSVVEVVRLFNAHEPNNNVNHNFYYLGLVGKFADDMVDIKRDIRRDRINLLYALVSQNSNELDNLNAVIKSGDKLGIRWWRKYCPVSFAGYYGHINEYYNQITSHKIRITGNLLLLPAVTGYDYDKAR